VDYSILEALKDQNEYPRKVRFPGPGKWISGILRISEVGFILFPRVHTVPPLEPDFPRILILVIQSCYSLPVSIRVRIRKQGFQRTGRTPEAATRKNRVPQLQFEGPGFGEGPQVCRGPPPPNLIGIPAAFSQKNVPKDASHFSSKNVPARRDRAFPPTEVTFQSRKCGRIILQNRLGN